MSNQVKRLKVGTWFTVKDHGSGDIGIVFERVKNGVLEVGSGNRRTLCNWEPVRVLSKPARVIAEEK